MAKIKTTFDPSTSQASRVPVPGSPFQVKEISSLSPGRSIERLGAALQQLGEVAKSTDHGMKLSTAHADMTRERQIAAEKAAAHQGDIDDVEGIYNEHMAGVRSRWLGSTEDKDLQGKFSEMFDRMTPVGQVRVRQEKVRRLQGDAKAALENHRQRFVMDVAKSANAAEMDDHIVSMSNAFNAQVGNLFDQDAANAAMEATLAVAKRARGEVLLDGLGEEMAKVKTADDALDLWEKALKTKAEFDTGPKSAQTRVAERAIAAIAESGDDGTEDLIREISAAIPELDDYDVSRNARIADMRTRGRLKQTRDDAVTSVNDEINEGDFKGAREVAAEHHANDVFNNGDLTAINKDIKFRETAADIAGDSTTFKSEAGLVAWYKKHDKEFKPEHLAQLRALWNSHNLQRGHFVDIGDAISTKQPLGGSDIDQQWVDKYESEGKTLRPFLEKWSKDRGRAIQKDVNTGKVLDPEIKRRASGRSVTFGPLVETRVEPIPTEALLTQALTQDQGFESALFRHQVKQYQATEMFPSQLVRPLVGASGIMSEDPNEVRSALGKLRMLKNMHPSGFHKHIAKRDPDRADLVRRLSAALAPGTNASPTKERDRIWEGLHTEDSVKRARADLLVNNESQLDRESHGVVLRLAEAHGITGLDEDEEDTSGFGFVDFDKINAQLSPRMIENVTERMRTLFINTDMSIKDIGDRLVDEMKRETGKIGIGANRNKLIFGSPNVFHHQFVKGGRDYTPFQREMFNEVSGLDAKGAFDQIDRGAVPGLPPRTIIERVAVKNLFATGEARKGASDEDILARAPRGARFDPNNRGFLLVDKDNTEAGIEFLNKHTDWAVDPIRRSPNGGPLYMMAWRVPTSFGAKAGFRLVDSGKLYDPDYPNSQLRRERLAGASAESTELQRLGAKNREAAAKERRRIEEMNAARGDSGRFRKGALPPEFSP